VLGENSQEVDAVAELRIAGNDLGRYEKRIAGFEFEFKACARGEWVHAFDVASAETQVGGSTVKRGCGAFGVNFDGHVDFESRGLASFDDGQPSLSRPLPRLSG